MKLMPMLMLLQVPLMKSALQALHLLHLIPS
jgi:hypothetical protein